jgi:hypothetical protein
MVVREAAGTKSLRFLRRPSQRFRNAENSWIKKALIT